MKPQLVKPESKRTIENYIRSQVSELKKSSMAEMFGEAAIQMQLEPEGLEQLKTDKWFLFLLGQIAELHAILYLAKVQPKRIIVKGPKQKVPKKKVKRKAKK
jgi:hypothetical protein